VDPFPTRDSPAAKPPSRCANLSTTGGPHYLSAGPTKATAHASRPPNRGSAGALATRHFWRPADCRHYDRSSQRHRSRARNFDRAYLLESAWLEGRSRARERGNGELRRTVDRPAAPAHRSAGTPDRRGSTRRRLSPLGDQNFEGRADRTAGRRAVGLGRSPRHASPTTCRDYTSHRETAAAGARPAVPRRALRTSGFYGAEILQRPWRLHGGRKRIRHLSGSRPPNAPSL